MNGVDNFDARIDEVLVHLGIPAHLDGYTYIKTGLKIMHSPEYRGNLKINIGDIFDRVANIYETSSNNVDRCIRYVVKNYCSDSSNKLLYHIFGVKPTLGDIKNKMFMVGVYRYLVYISNK